MPSMTFSGFVYASASTNDVKGHWAEKQLTDWQTRGLIHSCEDGSIRSIRPDNSISRADFMTLVNKAFSFSIEASISFSDVKKSDWYYYAEVAKAKDAGYISGYQDGAMRPKANISRQEVAIVLAKLAKLDTQNSKSAIAS